MKPPVFAFEFVKKESELKVGIPIFSHVNFDSFAQSMKIEKD